MCSRLICPGGQRMERGRALILSSSSPMEIPHEGLQHGPDEAVQCSMSQLFALLGPAVQPTIQSKMDRRTCLWLALSSFNPHHYDYGTANCHQTPLASFKIHPDSYLARLRPSKSCCCSGNEGIPINHPLCFPLRESPGSFSYFVLSTSQKC